MKCCARTAWSAFRQVDAIRWCLGSVETAVRWGGAKRLSVLGVLVVLGLVKVCWRCSITSGRRNCSVLGMPKCWKVGAGTFGPDALRWYLSSLPPSVRLGCFARLFLCLHVGAVSQPSIRPKFSISYRSWWARNLSVTSWNLWGFCIHWIERLLLRTPLKGGSTAPAR